MPEIPERHPLHASAPEAAARRRRQFASDTWSPMCPEAVSALLEANQGHIEPYGEDACTGRVSALLRELFACPCDIFLVPTGTSANGLALASLGASYTSVICHRHAHIETDECGAPEFFSHGAKLLPVDGHDGRLETTAVERVILARTDIHYPRPGVLSLTQATEVGTVYRPEAIRELAGLAHRHGLHVHMDGARFANAVARLGCAPADLTWRCGVDVLAFGGSKNGGGVGEVVVFFDASLARDFGRRCKQAGHLVAKLRLIAAPWAGLLAGGTWLRNAAHANAMADRLAAGLAALPGVRLRHPVEANEVFVALPDGVADAMQRRGWHFYDFIADGGWRLVCSWDTATDDVDAFLADLRDLHP